MFIKIKSEPKEKNPVTDVIIKDKKKQKYKALLRIIQSIHFLFLQQKDAEEIRS